MLEQRLGTTTFTPSIIQREKSHNKTHTMLLILILPARQLAGCTAQPLPFVPPTVPVNERMHMKLDDRRAPETDKQHTRTMSDT